jgi:hypothetical protein
MRSLKGKVHKTEQGNNSYEVFALEPTAIYIISTWLQADFGLEASKELVSGLNILTLNLWRGNMRITLGWDNWSGIFVMAHNPDDDALIEQISAYLEPRLHELEEHQWVPPS